MRVYIKKVSVKGHAIVMCGLVSRKSILLVTKKKKEKNIVIVRRVSDFFFVNISASRLLNNGFTEWNRASCVRSNRKLKLSSPQVRATKFTQ